MPIVVSTPNHAAGRAFLQIAAALLKTHMGVVSGARTLSHEGLEKLRRAASLTPVLLGLNLQETADGLASYFAPLAHGEVPTLGPLVPLLRLRED